MFVCLSPTDERSFVFQKLAKRKMTSEEMEDKRREMMESAEWRDKTRMNKIRENAYRDELEERNSCNKTAGFIR